MGVVYLNRKSDELDYIARVNRAESQHKNSESNRTIINSPINKIGKNKTVKYKISSLKIHKNITLDRFLVDWIASEATKFDLNFSETLNQIIKFAYDNSKK